MPPFINNEKIRILLMRLDVHYVSILYGPTVKDLRKFRDYISHDYPWMTGEPPRLFRRFLITPVCYTVKELDRILNEQRVRYDNGELEWLMFDSGGFQTMRNPSYTIDRLIEDNAYLYNRYPWVNAYIMPDLPAPPTDSISMMEAKIDSSISATKTLFNRLPRALKSKATPVFHARHTGHIDYQFDHYQDILSESNIACYAIGGINKKFTSDHMYNTRYLQSKFSGKIHLLGVGVPSMIWCLPKCGIYSYDALTPHAIASRGMISLHYRRANYSDRLTSNISDKELTEILKEIGHRCPFCDNREKLKSDTDYRRFHNAIVYDELNYFYNQMSIDRYKTFAPGCYAELTNSYDCGSIPQTLF